MKLELTRILHAGYIFSYGSSKIVFDPIFENPFSVNCYAFPEIEIDTTVIPDLTFDAVFISHYHEDHCSLRSLALLSRQTPIYLFCVHEELFQWIKDLGFTQVHALEWNRWIHIGSFSVKTLKAVDEDVDSLFHIQAGPLNILNAVDSWIHPQTFEPLTEIDWDLVLWPFQLMQELEVLAPNRSLTKSRPKDSPSYPEEWIEQWKSLAPKRLIPSSCQFRFEAWSWYNHHFFPKGYKDFRETIQSVLPFSEVIRLDPGETLGMTETGWQWLPPVPWIKNQSVQKIDYSYNPKHPIPSTQSIASHFSKLSDDDLKQIRSFCEVSIFNRYKVLSTDNATFFLEPRRWQLTIWDGDGTEKTYFYIIEGDHLKSIEPITSIDWLTEIPGYKLLGALNRGESLTSIYLRINDFKESQSRASYCEQIDLFEDPLLRVLYEGNFGSYQRHQRKELLQRD